AMALLREGLDDDARVHIEIAGRDVMVLFPEALEVEGVDVAKNEIVAVANARHERAKVHRRPAVEFEMIGAESKADHGSASRPSAGARRQRWIGRRGERRARADDRHVGRAAIAV